MRRVLLFVVFAIVSLSVHSSKTYDFEQNGIYYKIKTDGLWVVPYDEYCADYNPEYKYQGDIVIPSTVNYEGTTYSVIGIDMAFCRCPNLASVTIPNSVTTIGAFSFQSCGLTSITIPNSVITIDDNAFAYCHYLESVTIGSNVKTIGGEAFVDCTSLQSISIPNSVTTLGTGAFMDCTSLNNVTLGNGIKIFGDNVFDGCTSLVSVTISDGVLLIGGGAFIKCSSLITVNWGNSVESIKNGAFSGCKSLTSMVIPNSVISIEDAVFSGCSHLKTMELGDKVATIGVDFLKGCSDLISITSNNPIPPGVKAYTFYNVDFKKVILYVPKESVDAYNNANEWKRFKTIKAIGEDDNTDNTNTDNTTTDDNNTDDGLSEGDNGWSINIKIKGEDIAQCSIDNIESIEFTEDGLYIIINYKDGKSAKYDMSKFEAIEFTENSDSNKGADGDTNESNPLTLLTSNDVKYVLLSGSMVSDGDNVNGNLADDATIYWYMTPQSSWSPLYVHLLLGEKMSISDFPKGYDLGHFSINFGMVRSRENEYDFDSGSIKVTNNDGKSFTLEFNNYKVSKSSGASITLNGSLYVEKEK